MLNLIRVLSLLLVAASVGTPVQAAEQYRPNPYRSGHQESGIDWGQVIVGGLQQAARDAENNNNWNRPQNNSWNRNDDYYEDEEYYPQQRRTSPQPRPVYRPPVVKAAPAPPPVVPKKNKPAPEKIVTVKKNPKVNSLAGPIDGATYSLAGDVVAAQANQDEGKLEQALGDAMKDPQVAKKIDEIKSKIAQNQPVTQNDIDALAGFVSNANANGLKPGVGKSGFDSLANSLIGSSGASAVLNLPFPPGGVSTGFPTGPLAKIVLMPSFSSEDVLCLPGGNIMVGTSGQGAMCMLSGDPSAYLGLNIGAGEPLPDSGADVSKRVKSGVLLMNPLATGTSVEYVISNKPYTLAPSYSQTLPDGQTWVVKFDRGQGFGAAAYSLTTGTYVFGASDKGWELYRWKFTVNVDNTANEAAFNYVVDNTPYEIAAGSSKTHTSDYPLYVRYDRGLGGKETTKKVDQQKLTLDIAVNAADSGWDLYASEDGPGGVTATAVAESKPSGNKAKKRLTQLLLLQKAQLAQQAAEQSPQTGITGW